MTYDESQRCYERAARIPGRSLTRSKAPGKMFDVGAGPMFARGGRGAVLYDMDGSAYIDMVCALGAVSLGYGVGLCGRVQGGEVFSLPHASEGLAADAVLQHVAPWASQVRFVKTGSEATHAAYRIAKRTTGREFVLVGDWAYHGWHEWCEKRLDGLQESSHTVTYRHGQDLESTFVHGVHPLNVDGSEVAAVFVEPHRWEKVGEAWLRSLRDWCDRTGALLVFDEMIYGGRWALGGAAEYFGIQPDLACFGKAIGNGATIACVVGNEALAEHGQLVSGTYSGDADALSACAYVVGQYALHPVIETIWKRGRQLQRGLQWAVGQSPVPVVLEGMPVHQRLRFTEQPGLGRTFAAQMAHRGVLWHPDLCNVCYAHIPEQIERVVEAAVESLQALR